MKRRLLLLVVASAALYLLCLRDEWRPTWDSGVYLSLSRAIVRGEGYVYAGLPHVKYPPGLPLLCAPIEAVLGNDFLALRLLVTAFALLSVVLAHRAVALYVHPGVALPAAALFAFSYATVELVPAVLSDIPFTAFALASLLALRRFRDRGSWGSGLALAAALLAAFFTRIAGATVALAAAASLLRRRLRDEGPRWGRVLAVGFLVVAPAALWMVRTAVLRPTLPEWLRDVRSYEYEFETDEAWEPGARTVGAPDVARRVGQNVLFYRALLAEMFTGGLLAPPAQRWEESPGLWFLATAIAALALSAFARAALRRRSAAEIHTGATLLLYLLWPAVQGPRFLLPILPFLFAYALDGVRDAFARTRFPPAPRLATAVVASLLALASAPRVVATVQRERRDPYYEAGTEAFFQAARWLRQNAPPGSLVVADESTAVTLLSDLRGRAFPVTKSGEEFAAFVHRLAAESPGAPVYLVVAPVGQWGLTHFWPAIREAKEKGLLDGEVVREEVVEYPPEGGGVGVAAVWLLDV